MDALTYIAEQKVKNAIENGDFDNLPGFGKPVDNTEYFQVPEEERVAYHLMKNNGFLPEEVHIRKELYHLRKGLRNCKDLTKKEKLLMRINDLECRINPSR